MKPVSGKVIEGVIEKVKFEKSEREVDEGVAVPVSYTHLTLPTICSV